jgi:hypothetical protein
MADDAARHISQANLNLITIIVRRWGAASLKPC